MSPAPFNLKGRNAILVTRGGINAPALAGALTNAGATLATISWPGGTDDLEAAVSNAISDLGGIDILVNDLASDFAKPLADMTYAEWRTTIDLNLDSVFLSCKAAATHMLARQRGRIVNIASGLGARVVVTRAPSLRPRPGSSTSPAPLVSSGPETTSASMPSSAAGSSTPMTPSPTRFAATFPCSAGAGPRTSAAPSYTSPPTPAPSPPANLSS